MKQGTKFTLPVTLEGVEISEIQKVEFIFKLRQNKDADAVRKVTYPNDVLYKEDTFLIPWDMEDTYKIPSGSKFYMDTRIYLNDSADMPETPIIGLIMNPTLFAEDE